MKSAIIFAIGMGIGCLASDASAKVWSLTPVEASTGAVATTNAGRASAASNGESSAEVVPAAAHLMFDLSAVQADGRPVNIVYVEWRIDGVPTDTVSTFFVYGVSDSASVDENGIPSTGDDDLIETWECSPLDIMRNNGVIVVCDITELANEWMLGTRGNRGIVIKTAALATDELSPQTLEAKLVVR